MHWQTIWERAHPEYLRVNQRDWNNPDLADWSAAIARELHAGDTPAILVAHSFGCLAAVRSAAYAHGRIAAAMLVAPANPARFGIERELTAVALPFPSVLVASCSDPWLSFDTAIDLGRHWGSNLLKLGDAGHINAESGHGAWPEGERLLFELQRLVGTQRQVTS
jgi:predicted alpha/beta hydrolase family esterase